jgi:Zn-dependent protease with chaperone function
LRRLRTHGNDIIVNSKTHPRLKAVLTKGSAILGIAEPEAFLLAEGISQVRVFGRPTFVIVTQAALDLLQPAEVDCLLLRGLIHERQNHTRRLMLMKFLNDTPPAARLLAWPVGLYAFFLRLWWTDMAEMTADRLVLLLLKNHKLVQSALIKQHAATDPLMFEHEITAQDVDNYLEQSGMIGLQGKEISTQYKLGQAIHENPYLEDRLHQLKEWAESEEFKVAVQKLADARANKTTAK